MSRLTWGGRTGQGDVMAVPPRDPLLITLDLRPFRDAVRSLMERLGPTVRRAAFLRAGVTDTGPFADQHLRAVVALQEAVRDSRRDLKVSTREGARESQAVFAAAFTDLRCRWGVET